MTTTQPPNLRVIGFTCVGIGMAMGTIAVLKSDPKMTPTEAAVSLSALGVGAAIGGFGVPYLLRKMGI
jgi:hypothetical protein